MFLNKQALHPPFKRHKHREGVGLALQESPEASATRIKGAEALARHSLVIFGEPYGGKVTPTQFPNNEVPTVGESVADMNGMITALAIILQIFLIFGHDGAHIGSVGGGGLCVASAHLIL